MSAKISRVKRGESALGSLSQGKNCSEGRPAEREHFSEGESRNHGHLLASSGAQPRRSSGRAEADSGPKLLLLGYGSLIMLDSRAGGPEELKRAPMLCPVAHILAFSAPAAAA